MGLSFRSDKPLDGVIIGIAGTFIVLLMGRSYHWTVYYVGDVFPRREEVNKFVIAQ
jgi:hypothetical protein